MVERSILLETECVLRAKSEDDLDQLENDARDYMVNELERTVTCDEPEGATMEFCEVWVNEASTPKRMALDTAREEGWAKVLEAEASLLLAERMLAPRLRVGVVTILDAISAWKVVAAS